MRRRGISWWASVVCALSFAVASLALTGCGDNGPPDFTLALAADQPSSITITQGGTASIIFQVAAYKGSSGSISLTVGGLPAGVGIAPGAATVGIGSPQTFQLTAATTATLSSTPVTLTATGVSGNPLDASSITHSQDVTLSVVAPDTTQ